MSPILKVLHIGVANRGTWPLKNCTPATGFAPSALCDVSPAALAEARRLTSLPESACFTDVDQALANSGADCAIACVPTIYHVPVAKKAIDRGMPILIEKGMAPDWASAQDLVRTAAAASGAGRKVCVAQNYRYNAAEKTVRRALTDPTSAAYLGPVHLVQYTQHRVRPHPRTLTYPFASVWDMSCHHFDTLLSWLGPIRSVTAHAWGASWSPYEHPNNTTAHLQFGTAASSTAVHYIHTHDAARSVLDVQLHGERGCLRWTDDGLTFNARPLEQFGSRPLQPVPMEPAEGEHDLLRDFHAYLTADIEPGISARNNLETMAACELTVRSITAGRTVRREELDA